ncbi:MAG: SAM-dependent methyltransferase [Proteobacteria bacterium]|nr:SAM-dependent methyltransferase [Desulfobulbaceae bacterium]MBU4154448.1 SAM-dependent methyltransferase [Pseudomonadota bacterium]
MSFTLSEVVPWGRSYDEYVSMFSLSQADLKQKILGCGDGPANFNSTLSSKGGLIVSVDPVYFFTSEEIRKRITETYELVLEQTRKNREEFIWENISSIEELGRIRMSAMESFLKDFEKGKAEGRYIAGSLPHLPFYGKEFGIALCSHLLFLYSKQLSEEFHFASIRELCRVAQEVRIFPLLELGAKKSRHINPVVARLKKEHYHFEIRKVPYEFQKDGNEMIIIKSPNRIAGGFSPPASR